MEAVYIEPNNERELELFQKIAELIGAKSHILGEKEKKLLAGIQMVQIAERHPKSEITYEEIEHMAKEIEDKVYGKGQK